MASVCTYDDYFNNFICFVNKNERFVYFLSYNLRINLTREFSSDATNY